MTLQRFLNGMDQDTMEIDEVQKSLLDALRYFVGNIVEQHLTPKVPSHDFVSELTGLVYTLLMDHLPSELIAFSHHANRKIIQDEDLFLYCRKTSLCNQLKDFRRQITESPKKTSKLKRPLPDSSRQENSSFSRPTSFFDDSDE